jgi:hypothetical protein
MIGCFQVVDAVHSDSPLVLRAIALASWWIAFWLPSISGYFFEPTPNDSTAPPYWGVAFFIQWVLYSLIVYMILAYVASSRRSLRADPTDTPNA